MCMIEIPWKEEADVGKITWFSKQIPQVIEDMRIQFQCKWKFSK